MKISPWVKIFEEFDGREYCAGMTRIVEGGDLNKIADRVAFIEKTPRIRIRNGSGFMPFDMHNDYLNWAERPWKGDGPEDKESMQWCDDALRLFGYTGV
jgi:hypothetical protein